MFEMADVIVSCWFLPVTLCIIIPLLMLCGYAVFKLFMPPKVNQDTLKENDQLKNVVIQAE